MGADPNRGDWRAADFYSGGGSGHVVPPYVVKPFDGIQKRAAALGIDVIDADSDEKADVIIVVAGAKTAESKDRDHLHLADDTDSLIASVASGGGKVIVLMQVPGAILMPWKNSVHAILTSFYLGQETGNAWASVLFGDYSPTGHLPISMPETDIDTIQPGIDADVSYAEGLQVGYRNKKFKSSFPFGHGLSYTKFQYSKGMVAECNGEVCVTFEVKNVGHVAAATVPQLYLEFPPEAQQPSAILKGFTKTDLIAPGKSQKVTLTVSQWDMSYWKSGAWHPVSSATAHIGASSGDYRISVPIKSSLHELPPKDIVIV